MYPTPSRTIFAEKNFSRWWKYREIRKTFHLHVFSYTVYYDTACNPPTHPQAGQQVLEEDTSQLWWAGKQLDRSKLLRDYVGRNEKTKIVAKLQKGGQGAPCREPVFSAEEQKAMMALAHKKQEEMKVCSLK